MLEYNVCEKLIELYNSAGLKPHSGSVSLGEIKGVCAGVNKLFDMINVSNNLAGQTILKMADTNTIKDDFTGVHREVYEQQIRLSVFSGYDNTLLSIVDEKYFTPFTEVFLDGDGTTWQKFDSLNRSWRDIEKINFRFSMWECVNE